MRLLHLHLPRFPVQRKVLETPSLAHRPFALTEETKGQRRVAFASKAALAAGVRAGMSLTAASALVPELPNFPFRIEEEKKALASLGEALLSLSPTFELSPPEGLWLDACTAHLHRGEAGLAKAVIELCRTHGYRAGFCVASEKFTAKAIARHGGTGQLVPVQESARALAVLPLEALEGREAETVAPLRSLGLSRLGELAALPPGALLARLGGVGLRAQRLARGEDDERLVAHVLPEAIVEGITLDWPAESIEPLWFALKTIFDRVGARLSGRRQAAIRLELGLRLDPTGAHAIPLMLARPTAQPKLLLDLSKHRLQEVTLSTPIAQVEVRVLEACADFGQQLSLGEAPQGDAALEVVLSRHATRLGEEALFSTELKDEHRPEQAFAQVGFRPPRRERGLLSELPQQAVASAREEKAARPSRLFASPACLDAEVDATGTLKGARLLGRRRKVVAMAGPERLSGGWWERSPFGRDYYRVFFEGLGPAWVFRNLEDGRFYLQGLFD